MVAHVFVFGFFFTEHGLTFQDSYMGKIRTFPFFSSLFQYFLKIILVGKEPGQGAQ